MLDRCVLSPSCMPAAGARRSLTSAIGPIFHNTDKCPAGTSCDLRPSAGGSSLAWARVGAGERPGRVRVGATARSEIGVEGAHLAKGDCPTCRMSTRDEQLHQETGKG
jgi:hypothetical protein